MINTADGKWHEIWSAVCKNFTKKTGDTMTGALKMKDSFLYFSEAKGFGQTSANGKVFFCLYDAGGSHSALCPEIDNYNTLGSSSRRYNKMYSTNGVITSSDARLKENISDDLTALAAVFRRLRPVTYTYADTNDGLIRIGFVAQEVESAMAAEGLNADDYAFLRKDVIDADSEMAQFIGDTTVYSLNYSEFIALNTAMIQNLEQRLEELERRIL